MIVLPPGLNAGDTVYCFFDTYDSAGASVTITGLAVTDIEIYKNGSTTQRTSDNGYTLLDTDGIDFDGATGLQGFSVDTSDNSDSGFWVDGAQYLIHVNAITVDGQTVRFSFMLWLGYLLRPTTAGRKLDVSSTGEAGLDWANIGSPTTSQNLSGTSTKALEPTTAGRTLDVTTTGEAGIDWANVGSPTTTVNLSGTTIATTQKVDVETIKTNPVVNGGTVTFPTNATLASTTNVTAGTITTVTNLTNAPTSGDLTSTMKTSVETAVSNQLASYDAPTNTEMVAAFTEIKGATWSSVTDTLEAIRDRGDAAWITATTVTVSDKTGFKLASDGLALVTTWTVNITGSLSGSVGSVTGNVGGNVAGSIGSLATQAKADVNAEADTALVDYGGPTLAEVDAIVSAAISSLNDVSTSQITTAVLAMAYEGSETFQTFLRLVRSALVGKLAGAATTTVTARDAADSKDRITATVDASGNRTAVTVDGT